MAENDEKVEKRKRMKMKKEEERKYEQKRAMIRLVGDVDKRTEQE